MADLTYIDRDLEVKIVGQDSVGNRTNYVDADANGNMFVKDYSSGPVTPGAAAPTSALIGGQFNTALPTLTNTQQSAIQLDSNGRIIIAPLTSASIVTASEDHNFGTVGANTLRAAAQIGNATGAALFGAGTTTAQVLRVVLPTDQSAIPASQSGAWTVAATQSGAWTTGRTWTLASGTDSVSAVQSGAWTTGRTWALTSGADSISAVQSGTWTVQQGTPPWSMVGSVASGSADSGNPVKVGGPFNTTQPTVTNGQRVDFQATARGAQIVATGVDPFDIRNITGTVSLPTGAATAANQTTEITSLQLMDNPIGSVGAGTAGTSSYLIGGVFNTALPTLTNGQQSGIQLDSSGRQIIAPLTNASVIKIQLQDNAGNAINSDNGQILTQDSINTAGQNRAQSVTTSAAEALGAASILVNRKFISITPTNGTVYWGFANTVTTSTGTPIFKNQTVVIAATDNVHIYLIGGTTVDCRIAEGS